METTEKKNRTWFDFGRTQFLFNENALKYTLKRTTSTLQRVFDFIFLVNLTYNRIIVLLFLQ